MLSTEPKEEAVFHVASIQMDKKENTEITLEQQLSLKNYKTKGYGDCAFHAALGEWDAATSQFVCNDVGEVRKKIANAIRQCKLGDLIYKAVREAMQHIIGCERYSGKEINKVRKAYQSYCSINSYFAEVAWQEFEGALKTDAEIFEYVKKNTPPEKAHLDLKNQFAACLNINDEELYGRIYSLPDLQKKFKAYNDATNKDFKLDDFLKKQALLDEYADLMERSSETHASGYWLLPGELEIVARVLDITINFYLTDSNTKEKRKVEAYNPGFPNPKMVYFNGVNHYEKFANKGQYISNTQKDEFENSVSFLTYSLPSNKSPLLGYGNHPKAGLRKTLHGDIYQLKLLMLFLRRGLDNQYSAYELATEVESAGKFDDVVFKYSITGESKELEEFKYRYLQAKHSLQDGKVITEDNLLAEEDTDFSLQKYFISYLRVKEKTVNGKLQDFIICTNITFDFSGDNDPSRIIKFNDALYIIKEKEAILNISGSRESIRYRFKPEFKGKERIYEILKNSALIKLIDAIIECVLNRKSLDLRTPIFKEYHCALVKEVVNVGTKQFHFNFICNVGLSASTRKFREILFKRIADIKKFSPLVNYDFEVQKIIGGNKYNYILILDSKPPEEKREKAVFYLIKKEKEDVSAYYYNDFSWCEVSAQKIAVFDNLLNDKIKIDDPFEIKKILSIYNCVPTEMLSISSTFGKPSQNNDIFDLPDGESITNKEIDEFLSLLVFAVNQPNEMELGKIIANEIGEQFNLINSKLVFSYFQKEMLDWMKAQEGKFITHENAAEFFEHAKQTIDQLILIGPTLDYRAILEKTKIVFVNSGDLKTLLDTEQQVLFYLAPQTTFLTSVKVYQSLQDIEGFKFKLEGGYIFVRIDSCINLQNRLINAFKEPTCELLLIECNKQVDKKDAKILYNKLCDVLKVFPEKKIVLIVKESEELIEIFKEKMSWKNVSDQENGFNEFSAISQASFAEKTITFQGISTNFGNLVSKENLQEVVKGGALLELLNSEEIIIDPIQPSLSDLDSGFYTDRILYRRIQISKECLKENCSDLFCISNIDKEKLALLIKPGEQYRYFSDKEPNIDNPARYIILDDKEAREQFQELAKNFTKKNIHWLRTDEKYFIWQQSCGSVGGIRKHLVDHLDVDNEHDIKSIEENIIIISAEPGMGKSATVDHFADLIKKKDKSLWVIKIDLKTHKKLIDITDLKNIISVGKFLSEALLLSELGRSFLQYSLEKTDGKLALFLDGFDEILSEQQVKIIQFMQILQRDAKLLKMVVATRKHMQEDLEDALGIFSYNLKPFSPTDQKKYLKDFWGKIVKPSIQSEQEIEKFNKFSDRLCKSFSDATRDKDLEFMGIPLQTRLLAEAFQEDFNKYYTGNEEVQLPEKLDVLDLYRKFQSTKYVIYFNEKEKIDSFFNPAYKTLIADSLTKIHGFLAFKILFETYANEIFKDSDPFLLTENDVRLVGIIQFSEGKISFVHRMFAEYFVAELLANRLKKPQNHLLHQEVTEFLLLNIFKSRNSVILNLLEQLVVKENNPNLTMGWQKICLAVLLKMDPITLKNHNKIHVAEYAIDKANKNEKFVNVKELSARIESFSKQYLKPRDVFDFFGTCYQDILKVNDISFLEFALDKFFSMAKNREFNILKNEILKKINMLNKHYLIQCFSQNKEGEVKVKYELLASFSDIPPSDDPRGREVAKDVKLELEKYKKKLDIYKALKFLLEHENKLYNIEFLDTLSEEKILFLRIKNYMFNKLMLTRLISFFSPAWKIDTDFKQIFKELLLQVDKFDAEIVKKFFIFNKEHDFLKRLFNKFPELDLTEEEVSLIYEGQDLLWLECSGIEICYELKILTPKMVEFFVNVLNTTRINGYHTRYAANIFNKLILPLINMQRSSSVMQINPLSLIQMVATFIKFSSEHNVGISLRADQLEIVFKLIEKIFEYPLLSAGMLAINIQSLLVISDALQLKLINTNEKLLALEPTSDFGYELKLKHKSHIISLLVFKMEKPNEDFLLECHKAIEKMFPLPGDFMLQRNMVNSKRKESNVVEEPATLKKKKLKRAMSI